MSDSRLENNIKKEKKKNNEIKRKANDKKEKNNVNDITKGKAGNGIHSGRQYGEKVKWLPPYEKGAT